MSSSGLLEWVHFSNFVKMSRFRVRCFIPCNVTQWCLRRETWMHYGTFCCGSFEGACLLVAKASFYLRAWNFCNWTELVWWTGLVLVPSHLKILAFWLASELFCRDFCRILLRIRLWKTENAPKSSPVRRWDGHTPMNLSRCALNVDGFQYIQKQRKQSPGSFGTC